MPTFRLPIFLFFFVLAGLTLGSCQKKDDAKPQQVTSPQLTTGSWRLDQIVQNGQVASSGTGIKDQYSLTFRTDNTYTQKVLADNSTYNGNWLLLNNNTTLRLTDQKGDLTNYTLAALTATELRYSFTNRAGQLEERVFSAQP